MILVPAGVKVHIALGVTDLRKGLDGLAAAARPTSSKLATGTGRVFACSPSGWRKGASLGPERTRLVARWP